MSKTFSIRVSDDVLNHVERKAEELNMSKNAYIESILLADKRKWDNEYKKFFDKDGNTLYDYVYSLNFRKAGKENA